jgi:hypothetical protein
MPSKAAHVLGGDPTADGPYKIRGIPDAQGTGEGSMIFKQIDEILSGQKTQTRRVCKPDETWDGDSGPHGQIDIITVCSGGRVKWEVGRTYAVVPKRGQPAVWWKQANGRVYQQSDTYLHLVGEGYREARIRITAIRREPLQSITELDARAEGVASVGVYRDLWASINGKTKGARWADSPDVWVLTFEVVR